MTIQYRCPQCGGINLTVRVETDAPLVQNTIDTPHAGDVHSDAELYWDDDSWIYCQAEGCWYSGAASNFEVSP